jgi:hypothetical protein
MPAGVAPQSQITLDMLHRRALAGTRMPAHLVSAYFCTRPMKPCRRQFRERVERIRLPKAEPIFAGCSIFNSQPSSSRPHDPLSVLSQITPTKGIKKILKIPNLLAQVMLGRTQLELRYGHTSPFREMHVIHQLGVAVLRSDAGSRR